MIACICRAVSDQKLDAAIRAGARTLDEIEALTGAGSDCGCCRPDLEERLVSLGAIARGANSEGCGRDCADCPSRVASAA